MALSAKSTVEDVCAWLSALDFSAGDKYVSAARDQGLTGAVVFSSSAAALQAALQMTAVGHKMRFEKALAALRDSAATRSAGADGDDANFGFDDSPAFTAAPAQSDGYSAMAHAHVTAPAVPAAEPLSVGAPMAAPDARRASQASLSAQGTRPSASESESLVDRLHGPAETRDWAVLREGCLLKVRKSLGKTVKVVYAVLRQQPHTLQAVLELYEGLTFRSSTSLAGARIKPCGKAEFSVDQKRDSLTLRAERTDIRTATAWVLALQQVAMDARQCASAGQLLEPQTGFISRQESMDNDDDFVIVPKTDEPAGLRDPRLSISSSHSIAGYAPEPVHEPAAPSAEEEATWSALQHDDPAKSDIVAAALKQEGERQAEQRAQKHGFKSAEKQRSTIMKTSYMSTLKSKYDFLDAGSS
eukprot:m.47605 g.47605  ORF g.47605 m.47605 type:complete len:415 (-) comp5988_c0_seq3:278-1522(-)